MAMREIVDREQPDRKIGTVQTSHAKGAKQTKVTKIIVLDNGARDVVLRFILDPSGTGDRGLWPERIFCLRPDAALQIAKGILQSLPDVSLGADALHPGSVQEIVNAAVSRSEEDARQVVAAVRESTGYHRRNALKEVGIPRLPDVNIDGSVD